MTILSAMTTSQIIAAPALVRELMFVDPGVMDADVLLAGLARPIEVVRLPVAGDALAMIATAMTEGGPVGRLHILAHGASGAVMLSGQRIDAAMLAQATDAMAMIGDAMMPGAEIMLYACHAGGGADGAAFVTMLGEMTGAMVIAAEGEMGRGQGWDHLPVESAAFMPATMAGYQGRLSAFDTFDFETTGGDGTSILTQSVNGTHLTATMAGNNAVWDYGIIGSRAVGEFDSSVNSYTTSITFSFGGAEIYIYSIDIAETANNFMSGTYIFTPTGGSNNSAVTVNAVDITSTLSATSLNWSGVTGFTVTASGISDNGYSDPNGFDLAFDNLQYYNNNPSYAPTVTGVTSPTGSGSYKAGDLISIRVEFSEAVTVDGTPQLTLKTDATDRVVDYHSGSGTSILQFNYTVQAGDTAEDLDYVSSGALALNGGTIRSGTLVDADLTLPAPGMPHSLADNMNIVIDTTAPTVSGVASPDDNTRYKIGDIISIEVAFDGPVTVTGTPKLALNSGGTALYQSGSDTSVLTFKYTIHEGDESLDLDFSSTTALSLDGGTIRDAAGNSADLTLSAPGTSHSLGRANNIVIDGVAPTVTTGNLTLGDGTNGFYNVGTVVTANWLGGMGGDGNTDIASVIFDFGAFGGDTVSGDLVSGEWSAGYMIQPGSIDAGNRNISITVTDTAGNTTSLTGEDDVWVDNAAPIVTAANIAISGASGNNGIFIAGDTITASWDNSSSGDHNSDNGSVQFDFSAFGGSTIQGSEANGIWTASHVIAAGSVTGSHLDVTVIVTDDDDNVTSRIDDAHASADAKVPVLISIERASGAPATTSADTLTFTATFSKAVELVSMADFHVTGGSGATVTSLVFDSSFTVATLTVSGGDLAGFEGMVGVALNETVAGGDAAGNLLDTTTSYSTEDYGVDNTGPSLSVIGRSQVDAVTNADSVTFTIQFDEDVVGVDAADFTVTGGSTALITDVATLYGGGYELTVSDGHLSDYSGPLGISMAGNATIEDLAGNAVIIGDPILTEGYIIDHAGPEIASATVNGRTMILTFTDAADLDADNPPIVGSFEVEVAGSENAVTAVAVDAAARTVTLTLTTAVKNGQAVKVSYEDPSGFDDMVAIQDEFGRDAASFSDQTVTNLTLPSPSTGGGGGNTGGGPVLIDGVPVKTVTQTGSDGKPQQVVTIPTITDGRVDSNGPTGTADIALNNNQAVIHVPTGTGAQVVIPTPGSGGFNTALGGSGGVTIPGGMFINTLDPTQLNSINTYIVTPGQSQGGFTFDGPTIPGGGGSTAVIINGGNAGSPTYGVNNVDFVQLNGNGVILADTSSTFIVSDFGNNTVVGAFGSATILGGGGNDSVIGGTGNNMIYGNRDSDLIYGNQGDDLLYGGQQNDILFGGQGDDVIYGNNGNDTVAGSLGDDVLYGGQGDDILVGDVGDDTLFGGQGHDIFLFGVGGASGHDVIADYKTGEDVIALTFEMKTGPMTSEAVSDGLLLHFGDDSILLIGISDISQVTIA